MQELIISSIYFILPAYVANMFPVILGKLNFPLGIPINARWFGKNKTVRGLYAGVFGAFLVLLLQKNLAGEEILTSYSLLDYSEINIFLYAALFGLGAIFGDLIESFIKRRLNIKPGKPFFPFDQIDFVLGAYLFLLPYYVLPWQNLVALLLITPLLHFLANIIAYFLGIKKVWW